MRFTPGERVLFLSRAHPLAFHCFNFGLSDRVMHLNARDERGELVGITGRVLRVNQYEKDSYMFRPDGAPAETAFQGFETRPDELHKLDDPHLMLPGTWKRPDGKELDELPPIT